MSSCFQFRNLFILISNDYSGTPGELKNISKDRENILKASGYEIKKYDEFYDRPYKPGVIYHNDKETENRFHTKFLIGKAKMIHDN